MLFLIFSTDSSLYHSLIRPVHYTYIISIDICKNAYFPISYKFDIELLAAEGQENCTYDITNQRIKVMTGGKVVVGDNVTLNGRYEAIQKQISSILEDAMPYQVNGDNYSRVYDQCSEDIILKT